MPKKRRRKRAAGSSLTLAFVLGCGGVPSEGLPADAVDAPPTQAGEGEPSASEAGAEAEIEAAVVDLIDYAARRRAALDFGALAPWSERAGADPLMLLRDGSRTLGLVRRGEVVVLDDDAGVQARATTLWGATSMVRAADELVIASAATGELDVRDAATLAPRRRLSVPGVASLRGIAWGADEGQLYLADAQRHRILSIPWPAPSAGALEGEPVDTCSGALAIARTGEWLVYDCLFDHRVVARHVDDGRLGPRVVIEHDGPIWSFDAVAGAEGVLSLVLGGVEDRPLDRSDGAFGYIDSFVFVYDVAAAAAPIARRRLALNVSEYGVVTPKRVRWSNTAATGAMVTGYGSDVALTIEWPTNERARAEVQAHRVVPGVTDFTGTLERGTMASPLLDAWIVTRPGESPRVASVSDPEDDRTPSERLGEALAFTGLIAPRATSEGRRSRFTCETCHFEGTTDGRTHWTGREDVHATTKTLRGLLNNRPHFSRALDRTTARMVHSEFRVANRGTDQDPWFSLTRVDAPWLDALGAPPDPIDPVTLRRALVDFLAAFTPEPNPAVRGLVAFTPQQQAGARLFQASCESCHRARLIADDPASAVAPERWPALILSPAGGIVWGSEARYRTGVTPYVHADGPRAPSLRRSYAKRPLLTNGSAATLDAVLDAVRLDSSEVHGGGAGRPLDADQHEALAAFLELL